MNQPLNKPRISQISFVHVKTTKLTDDYKILKKLGSGAFSEVFLIQDKIKENFDCVKVIDKRSLIAFEGEDIMNEINTLAEMDHPHIMKVKGYYETNKHLYILSEYLSGGELFDRISKAKKFLELEAATYIEQILSAVSYLHKHNIIHRDLKPENVCFENNSPKANLKIIDFGTSKKIVDNSKLHSRLGTAYYIAPEVLDGSYDNKCDIWSCGVILYVFLFGVPPFNGKTDEDIFGKIKSGKFKFPELVNVSPDAKYLITQMLTKNPEQRPTADALLKSPWFAKIRSSPVDLQNELTTLESFVRFNSKNEFQKAILLYFVSFFDLKEEKSRLLQIFKDLDKDHDGQLDKNEIAQVYKSLATNPDADNEIGRIFEQIDVNKTGSIDFTEFLLATVDYKADLHDKELQQIFDIIDLDKNGFLEKSEIAEFFSLTGKENELTLINLIKEVDSNNDGVISYDEFKTLMNLFLKA